MMGLQTVDQSQLFYLFNLERRIPVRHLMLSQSKNRSRYGISNWQGPVSRHSEQNREHHAKHHAVS